MSERTPIHDEKELAAALRREARQSRPEFSQALHLRICRAIRQCPAGESPVARRPARRRALVWVVGIAAAASVTAAAVFLAATRGPGPKPEGPGSAPLAGGPPPRQEPPDTVPPAVELHSVTALTDRVATGLPALVDSELASRQWAYLDHDARLTVQALMDRLPTEVGASRPGGAANTP